MAYSNSSLATARYMSPNHSGTRNHSIDRITPHCVVGQLSGAGIGSCFKSPSRQASCNYGIGTNGEIVLIVEEKNRSWCTSSAMNDNRAVTFELASDVQSPYQMNNKVWNSLIKLCVDVCKRNGKKKLLWLGTKANTDAYAPKSDEMVISIHRWYANKACPGQWLVDKLGTLAKEVTKQLSGSSSAPTPAPSKNQNTPSSSSTPFNVRVDIKDLAIRKGPGTNYAKTGKNTGSGTFTITDVKSGKGSDSGWGKLKSGAGWISLDYATRIKSSSSSKQNSGSSKPSQPTPKKTPKWVGKVTASKLNVRTGAGASYSNLKSYPYLYKGNLVDVCDTAKASNGETWYYIRIAGKHFGFVSSKYIKKA